MLTKFITICSLIFLFSLLLSDFTEVEAGRRRKHHRRQQAGEGSRAIGYNKGKKKITKQAYKWRPSEDTKLALAKQKGIPEEKIQEKDPEFEFLWADDYYDDYDFEHVRNMIQHGTWEAKRQNYYEAELKAAKEAMKKEGDDAVA